MLILQQMVMFIKDPIELNYADVAELNQLRVLTPIQIQNFILYRNLVGKLVNLYELQAVPGWDIGTIQNMLRVLKLGGVLYSAPRQTSELRHRS